MRYYIQIEIKNPEDKWRVKRVLAHLLNSPEEWDGPTPKTVMTLRTAGAANEPAETDGWAYSTREPLK